MIASISSCMSIKLEETEEMSTFTIKDTDKNPKHHGQFQVSLFKSDSKLLCSCCRFELSGQLCRHCFYVLRMESVEIYPKAMYQQDG
ncbi:hypothetical protein L2E82_38267 [Cichorium intybus]|uniref:Uncharacterized protein n=1 Tax=Cichorium intybus TaxID=13427 RepID=A0ACB9AGH7_CICIN|nr:hypothetical protein L2E82_38267 [Cichorium intybus]